MTPAYQAQTGLSFHERAATVEQPPMAEPAPPPNEDVRAALTKLNGQAREWTMSEDAKLEACMAAMQARLEQRSGRLNRRLAEFGLDLERTHAKLGNVFNEFDGLSHSQVATAPPLHFTHSSSARHS